MSGSISHVSHDKVAELKETFSLLDPSGEGVVDMVQIRQVFKLIVNMSDESFDSLLKEAQMENFESITFAQFFVLVSKVKGMAAVTITPEQRVRDLPSASDIFIPFDKEKTGYVDESVFFSILAEKGERLTEEECLALKTRLERAGYLLYGKVQYRAFFTNLLGTDYDTPLI